jgi:hypothetical protein
MFTHIVLFKLKDPPAHADDLRERLLALRERIPFIRSMEVGIDVLRQQRSYDLALTVRFDSRADHDRYQEHPAHRAFAEFLAPLRDAAVAVDYEV